MKTALLFVALCLAVPGAGFAYSIDCGSGPLNPYLFPVDGAGTRRSGSHWDEYWVFNKPGYGEYALAGGGIRTLQHLVTILPELGDQPAGRVQVLLQYETSEFQQLSFTNYQPAAFDYHYDFCVEVREFSWESPLLARYELTPGVGTVLLELNVGVPFELDFVADAADIHAAFANWTWRPAVVDPLADGVACAWVEGKLTPISLQVVPEPGSLSLCLLGSLPVLGRALTVGRRGS